MDPLSCTSLRFNRTDWPKHPARSDISRFSSPRSRSEGGIKGPLDTDGTWLYNTPGTQYSPLAMLATWTHTTHQEFDEVDANRQDRPAVAIESVLHKVLSSSVSQGSSRIATVSNPEAIAVPAESEALGEADAITQPLTK